MGNDFGVVVVRLFGWLINLMNLKDDVQLPFLNVVKHLSSFYLFLICMQATMSEFYALLRFINADAYFKFQ
ncbi:hypothetical protein VIGAN_09102300 [Vigna angularis var. angularis]|uniref:Uncharacterized protein n=1 Tax=Vigna angularis var. angularis TaxID=157739 RepID=A0A0S3SXW9_PHAAN|nr:hypothetical protein VIGAN_09102300 [Vigna angularis var. angularis]